LLHSAEGSTLTETAPLARRLEQHFHVLALDFSGSGASDAPDADAPDAKAPDAAPEPSSMLDLLADNVRAVLDFFSLKRVHVFGNALGGYVALYLAGRLPAYIDRLVLHETNRYAPAGDAGGDGSGVPWNALDDEALGHLEARALVTAGDRGNPVPLDMTLRLFRRLPDAALALLPDTGHSLADVDLEGYAHLVQRWLRG
jgi:pimeloyl-ACP methyl ester carboxylesterase